MRLAVILPAAVVGLLVAGFLRPDFLDAWSFRFTSDSLKTSSGYDVNLVTRMAEAKGFWEGLTHDSWWRLVFGKGFGAYYLWSYDFSNEVRSISVEMVHIFFAPTWEAGHSPFTYALFFGGVPALIWQLSVFFNPLIKAWRASRVIRTTPDDGFLYLYSFSTLSIIFYLSQSFTSNPFAERLSAQYLGLSVGLILSLPLLAVPQTPYPMGVRTPEPRG